MKFTSFGHYVVERLGMSRRNAQALVALRRKFFDLPRVAAAFLAGEITRSQAEVIGRVADDTYEHEWIEYARKVSFVHLRRLVKVRRTIKERSPGEFWDTCRRPPPLPDVDVLMCAPAEGGLPGTGEDAGTEDSPEPSATGQTCAPAEGAFSGDGPGDESDVAAETPAGVQVCAPTEGALSGTGPAEESDPAAETPAGNIKAPASIAEPLQVAVDNGALRALIPVANRKQVATLPEEVVERLDLVFYGEVERTLTGPASPAAFSSIRRRGTSIHWRTWCSRHCPG